MNVSCQRFELSLFFMYRPAVLTPGQIRAARGLLGWNQAKLAELSRISISALKDIERETRDPRASTLRAIEEAFNRAGITFLEPNPGKGRGLRWQAGAEEAQRQERPE
jgi:transcriptional regulator with XRE-family HTH domain